MKNTTSKPTEKNNKTEIAKNKPRAIASGIKVWCRHDELKDVTELVENPRNPNKHPNKQIALLAKIIRGQGWRQPITISNRSGFIVKGHGRLQAAKVLNVELVPVEYQDYESEAAEYADLMADNRIAELAEPDANMIDELLKDAMFEDFDLELTGFTDKELMPDETKLEKMDINRPPNMTWHLVGIPTVKAHEIQDQIDIISKIENVIIETGCSD